MEKERAVSQNFASIIKYYRENKGFSLKELAEMTGISASYLNRLERGERRCPTIAICSRIAGALDVPLTRLLDISLDISNVEQVTVAEVLLGNNFSIGNKDFPQIAKELLTAIVEFIIAAEWDIETKTDDMFQIFGLIDEFKIAL